MGAREPTGNQTRKILKGRLQPEGSYSGSIRAWSPAPTDEMRIRDRAGTRQVGTSRTWKNETCWAYFRQTAGTRQQSRGIALTP